MDEKKRLAELHMRARYDAGKSQEYIALEMGVSKKTVANWEKGISTPDIFDSFRWFCRRKGAMMRRRWTVL